jgi:hypothetical protein
LADFVCSSYSLTLNRELYAILEMAGFHVNTIRSCDKATRKMKEIAEFSDPTSQSQIFLANINIMATGVNLHECCSRGIILGFHHNAKIITHAHGRIHRINQKNPVVWHDIKVKDTYHDHQEKSCMTKLVKHLSAEADIPDWLTGILREIVIWDLVATQWGHPFNRGAWQLLNDLNPGSLEFNSPHTIKVGHCLTLIARILYRPEKDDKTEYWNQHQYDIIGALDIMARKLTVEELEDLLLMTDGHEIHDKILTDFGNALAVYASSPNKDIKSAGVRSMQEMRTKDTSKYKSPEFIEEPDSEGEGTDIGGVEEDEFADGEPSISG